MPTTEIETVQWHGCYDEGWRDLIVPAAFAHPAKMGRGLVARIFDELFARGAVRRGAIVVDPFGGIGTTAIEGASRGVQVVCCELEPKFVALARENFQLHARDWSDMGRPLPQIVNGDSRQLRANVGPVLAECLVSSPPYASSDQNYARGRTTIDWEKGARSGMKNDRISGPDASYGDADGQLASMPEGNVDAVISSPPYAEIASGSGGLNTKPAKDGQQGGRSAAAPSQDTDSRYGTADGQLARMALGDVDAVVSSPPFLDARSTQTAKGSIKGSTPTEHDPEAMGVSAGNLQAMRAGELADAIVSSPPFTQGYSGGGGINVKGYGADGKDKVGARTYQGTGNERSEGNLESLTLGDVDAVVGSPPFGADATGHVSADKWKSPEAFLAAGRGNGASDAARLRQIERDREKTYGETEGQLAAMPMTSSADAVVSSPPYEGSLASSEDGIDWQQAKRANNDHRGQQRPGASVAAAYPVSEENIGNATGETFWSAALDIVRESYAVLKPGGTAVWVVKHFVRDKAVVDFPGDWRKLCESVGFVTDTEVHAMLVKEETTSHLFDGEVTKRRERKSFFRRLAEKKGSPRIDWETVYFMRKPEAPCHEG